MLKLEKCLEVTSGREVGVLGGCDVLTAVLIYDVHLSCHDRPVPLNMLRGTGEPTPIFQLDIFNLLEVFQYNPPTICVENHESFGKNLHY